MDSTKDPDLLYMVWFVQPNDVIGGWCIRDVNSPPSDDRCGRTVMDMVLSKEIAEHIVLIHNIQLINPSLSRMHATGREDFRKFGPKTADHPNIGQPCPGCLTPFVEGDYTTLVTIGPGIDPEAQERARGGRPYTAVASEAHWTCVTGEPV